MALNRLKERILTMAKKKKAKAKTKKAAAVKARTKSEIYRELSEKTGLTRKQVVSVFDEMSGLLKKDLGRRGPGTFTVPGLLKVRVGAQARDQGAQGHQPVHRRRDDVQGQARAQRGQGQPAQGPQGHGLGPQEHGLGPQGHGLGPQGHGLVTA
jgi:hypothetical protein